MSGGVARAAKQGLYLAGPANLPLLTHLERNVLANHET